MRKLLGLILLLSMALSQGVNDKNFKEKINLWNEEHEMKNIIYNNYIILWLESGITFLSSHSIT